MAGGAETTLISGPVALTPPRGLAGFQAVESAEEMAAAVAEGVAQIDGAEAVLRRVPETLPAEVLEKMGAVQAQESMADVPICTVDELAAADAVIFGTPTRFGNMCGQMRQFLDATGSLWAQGALVGKVGSVFASTGTQHGGQETTITSFHKIGRTSCRERV